MLFLKICLQQIINFRPGQFTAVGMSSKSLSDKTERFCSYVKVVSYSLVLWRRRWIFSLRGTTKINANIIGWSALLDVEASNRWQSIIAMGELQCWTFLKKVQTSRIAGFLLRLCDKSEFCILQLLHWLRYWNGRRLKDMKISEQSLDWGVFEDTESKMLRVMFKFEEFSGV